MERRAERLTMIRFLKWLFNCSEYGCTTYDPHGLYRRGMGSDAAQMKHGNDWVKVSPSNWLRFIPFNSDVQTTPLPNGQQAQYSVKRRLYIGEQAFFDWLKYERQRILEQMIREKYK